MEHSKNTIGIPAIADSTQNPCTNKSPEAGSSNKINNQLEMLTAHQILIKNKTNNHRKDGKALLQSNLSQARKQIERCQENERILLTIFPEEIWTIILGNIYDWRDLTNCAATSPFFDKILNPTNNEWLFGKVFPMTSSYIDFHKILDCRLVCKRWCSGVDNNLEEINHTLKKTECEVTIEALQEGSDPVDFTHFFSVPEGWDHDYYYCNEDILDDLKSHPRNPFISRSLNVCATNPEFSKEDFSIAFPIFLSDFGQHIFHLKLFTQDFEYTNSYQCYSTCVQILSKCSLIRSISISGGVKEKSECEFPANIDPLPDHQYLESVIVDMDYRCVPQCQDKLVEKYSGQLKKLSVHLWNSSAYHNHLWENLRELEVKQVLTDGLLNNLLEIKAPLVQKLIVTVGQLKLEQLIELIKQFPNLDNLKLRFSKEFTGFDDKEVIKIPLDCWTKCTAIRTIQLDTSCLEYGLSYNFLILFPFLKKIYLRVDAGKENVKLRNPNYYPEFDLFQISKCVWDSKSQIDILSNPNYDSDPEPFRVFRHVWNKSKHRIMYESPLWDMIDTLWNVEICRVITENLYDDDTSFEIFESYSREGYNRRKCDTKDLLNYHVKCVEKETERQRQFKASSLRDKFAAFEICEPLKTKDADDIFPEKIWKLILAFLNEDDLSSCSNSSNFLAEILEETKSEWLFDKIFPILYNHLEKVDILTCRAVCKRWCSGVDKYLENYLTLEDQNHSNKLFTGLYHEPNEFDFEYDFLFPRDSEYEYYHNKVEDDLERHSRNPFVGRAVSLTLSSDEQQATEIQEFVESFGDHIWHFSVVGESENENEKYIRLSPKTYFRIVHRILTNCPNIRSLHLSNIRIDWPYKGHYMLGVIYANKFPDLQYFESLHMLGHNKNGEVMEDILLEKYGSQLRHINISRWSKKLYENLENLRELQISQRMSDQWLEYLTNIEAPNLKELHLKLDGEEPMLTTLVAVTNNFPNINKLTLELCENFKGFTEEEIVDHTFGFFSPPGLTNLEIVTGRNYCLSFDFLFFFPYLKRLKILSDFDKCEKKADNQDERDCDSSSDEEGMIVRRMKIPKKDEVPSGDEDKKDEGTQICNTNTPSVCIIDLPNRFWNQSGEMNDSQMREKIRESNIWQILRSLEFLEIKNKLVEATGTKLTFRRQE